MSTIRPHSCATIREMAFNYRRGELSEVDAALFEDTIASCPTCGRYASRLIDMLDVATEARAEDYLERPLDAAFADDLFGAILSGIARGEEGEEEEEERDAAPFFSVTEPMIALAERPAPRQPLPRRPDPWQRDESEADASSERTHIVEEPLVLHPPAWRRPAVALALVAAVALLAVGVTQLLPAPHQETQHAPLPSSDALVRQAREVRHLEQLEQLSRRPATPDAIKVFASEGAAWHVEGEAPHYTLRLDQGTMLVEFLPRHGESLHVISQQTEIDVVGTVFFVSTEEDATSETARVGVLTGKVRVKQSPEQPMVELEDGQEIQEDAQLSVISDEAIRRTESFVDLDAHKAALEKYGRRAAASEATHRTPPAEPERVVAVSERDATSHRAPSRVPRVERPAAEEVVEAAAPLVPTERERLELALEEAMRAKNYARAASISEELLLELPTHDPEHATRRLELSRLYMRQLGRRDDAITHLRRFVDEHPGDVAAPSARRQLCRLLGPRAMQEEVCTLPEP